MHAELSYEEKLLLRGEYRKLLKETNDVQEIEEKAFNKEASGLYSVRSRQKGLSNHGNWPTHGNDFWSYGVITCLDGSEFDLQRQLELIEGDGFCLDLMASTEALESIISLRDTTYKATGLSVSGVGGIAVGLTDPRTTEQKKLDSNNNINLITGSAYSINTWNKIDKLRKKRQFDIIFGDPGLGFFALDQKKPVLQQALYLRLVVRCLARLSKNGVFTLPIKNPIPHYTNLIADSSNGYDRYDNAQSVIKADYDALKKSSEEAVRYFFSVINNSPWFKAEVFIKGSFTDAIAARRVSDNISTEKDIMNFLRKTDVFTRFSKIRELAKKY